MSARLVVRLLFQTEITPETFYFSVSSAPKCLLVIVKRNGNITKWSIIYELFFEVCCGNQTEMFTVMWKKTLEFM